MYVKRTNGLVEKLDDMSKEDVVNRVQEELERDDVKQIIIKPNRHERRKEAVLARKKKVRE